MLAACFAAILGFVACLAGLAPAWRHLDALLPLWLLAGAAWCAAIWLARDGRLPLLAVVAGALVLRALALTSWPDLSDDINRYAGLSKTKPLAAASLAIAMLSLAGIPPFVGCL